jgi:hypothetical protein
MVPWVLPSPALRFLTRLARLVRIVRLVPLAAISAGLIALAASAGPGCSVTGVPVTGDGSTLVPDDAGIDALAPEVDGSTCQPGDVRTFVPVAYRHATGAWQGACSSEQIADFYTACIASGTDGGASTVSCGAFSQASASNAACATCILTPESMPAYGPLVDHGTFITENVGGCVELTDPTAGLVCAKAQQALAGCELAACEANCPVHDNASRDSFDTCTTAAASAGCQAFATQAGCVATLAEAGTSTACVTSFLDFYNAVVPVFCGSPPPIDGGGPRADAGASDAGGMDASSEASSTDAPPGDAASAEGSTDGAPAEASTDSSSD